MVASTMKILITLALLSGLSSAAQTSSEPQPSRSQPGAAVDAVGTEFTIFFQENAARRPGYTFQLQLFLTTHQTTPVTVRVRLPLAKINGNPSLQQVTVTKGKVTEVNFPQTMMHIGSGVSNRGIHILANAPIVVYGVNPQRFSSEGFIAIPNHLLGTEYYAVGMPAEDQHSQLGAVAVEAGDTEVTVTLPDNAELRVSFDGRHYSANDVIVAKLSQYQTMQLQHRNSKRGVPEGDMSGARIQCTKRCAAFSGNSRTSVSGDSRDLLVEQLPPVSTWGKEFAVPPTPERTDRPDILKIVCQQIGTTVLVDGLPFSCNAGSSIQTKINTTGPHYVTATKPVMAATVVMSQAGQNARVQADPAMTLIIPEEQYAQTYTIATATWSGAAEDGKAYKNFLTVVIRRDRIDSVVIDGVNVNTAYPGAIWKDIPSTAVGGKPALVTTYFNITSGTHTISTLQDDTRFMCIVYGAGDRESYAYMGGMRLKVINPACTQVLQTTFGDGVDNDCDARIDEEFCDGLDDDKDGAVDEDCIVKNDVIPAGDVTVFVGQTATLKWTVYATDFTNFKGLKLYKQQCLSANSNCVATAAEILAAEGSGTLTLTKLFADTGRYSVKVSNAVKKGELFVVEVDLTISGANTVDPGDYKLVYTAHNGTFDGINRLSVQQKTQQYEIIAKDLTSGSTQYARSTQPTPRNLYFQENKKYSLTFHSIGGKHLDDLPYRQFFNDVEATGDFEVIGLKKDYVTGSVTGLQHVKTVYELMIRQWTAVTEFDKKILSVKNDDMVVVDSAVLNVESLVRPSINCRFELNAGNASGRVVCRITDVKVNLDQVYWTFDGDVKLDSPSSSGPYTTAHTVDSSNSEMYQAAFDGIRPDQWPANTNTRVFQITFNQTNGYTLSAQTSVTLSQFPAVYKPGVITCSANVSADGSTSTITCTNKGGKPGVDSASWRANLGGDNVVVNGGRTVGRYASGSLSELSTSPYTYSITLTVNRRITGQETYMVIFMRDGNREVSTLNVTAPVVAAAVPGVVSGRIIANPDRSIILVATVTGGSPAADTFNWTLPDGTVLLPGRSNGSISASEKIDNSNGSISFKLTLSEGLTSNPQSIVFRVASGARWSGVFTFNIGALSKPSKPGVVQGLIFDNPETGEVSIPASVSGGLPPPNTFIWTVPNDDGSFTSYPAGQNGSSAVHVNPEGNPATTLNVTRTGLQPKTYSLNVTCVVDGEVKWWASKSWTTRRRIIVPSVTPGTVSGRIITNADGSIILVATVTGGSPAADTFNWTLPDGTILQPGGSSGSFSASRTINNGDGSISFNLTLSKGHTINPQTIVFRVASGASWSGVFTFNIAALSKPATITSRYETGTSEVTVYMTVTGGSPAMTSHQWSFKHNGRDVLLKAGDSSGPFTANQPQDIGSGSKLYTLTIKDLKVLPMGITFKATSTDNKDVVYWTARAIQSIPAAVVPPTVVCGLRTNNLRIGDEVELVCTVQPTPVAGHTHNISNLFYTNILSSGSESNISSTVSNPAFRYVQKVNVDGTIDVSLFFKLMLDFSNFKRYKFTVDYNGGVIVTQINLNSIFKSIANRPKVKYVVGIESQMVMLTCVAQANSSLRFDGLIWKRKSLGASGRVQTIYERQQVQARFKSTRRYFTTNTVTSNGFLESTLKITNLQRTDVADYSCVWSNNVNGEFLLDVIGSSFMVNSNQFNKHLTPFSDSKVYTLTFEFESVDVSDYLVKYGGRTQTGLAVTSRNGTRYDSFAQESVPVRVYTLVDSTFAPANTFVIQTFYRHSRLNNPSQENKIADYILTKKAGESGSTTAVSFSHVMTDRVKYGKDATIRLITGLPVKLSVTIVAPTCDQEIRIIVGARDLTSQFTKTSQVNGTSCYITFTRDNYIGNGDNGRTIQTVAVLSSGNVILSENLISVTNPPPTSTAGTLSDKTDSCSDRNGGCHHKCVTDNATHFHCECEAGFTLQPNGRICLDNNECLVLNGGCDYICTNTEGSFKCDCPSGLKLSANGKSCIDDDECQGNPCSSMEKCVNTFGGYHCIAGCECNCCDNQQAGNATASGRKKRSVSEDEESLRSHEAAALSSMPLNGVATLTWLLMLTLFSSATFCITIHNRRAATEKLSTLG